jgi:hypothetical protein
MTNDQLPITPRGPMNRSNPFSSLITAVLVLFLAGCGQTPAAPVSRYAPDDPSAGLYRI